MTALATLPARPAAAAPPPPPKPARASGPRPCVGVDDVYAPEARALLGSLLRPVLEQFVITPSELLHLAKHQSRVESAGNALRSVLEKLAQMQAPELGQPVPQRLRALQDLLTLVMLRSREVEKQPATPIRPGSAAAALAQLRRPESGPPGDYAALRALSELLAGVRTWTEKLEMLLGLADELSSVPERRLIDRLIAETLMSQAAQEAVFGRKLSAGARIEDLLALRQGDAPSTGGRAPSLPAQRLAALLAGGRQEEIKASIETLILHELAGRDQMASPELVTEMRATHEILGRLRQGDEIVGGNRALALIDRRMARLLQQDAVVEHLRGHQTLGEKLIALFQLRAVTFGPNNKLLVENFIRRYFTLDDFGRRMIGGEGSPILKLKTMASLHRAVVRSTLPHEHKVHYAALVSRLQMIFVERTKLFATLDRRSPDCAKKALHVITLCLEGTFIPGDNLERAKSVIRHYLRQQDFMKRYLGQAPREKHGDMVKLLRQRMAQLGLSTPQAV